MLLAKKRIATFTQTGKWPTPHKGETFFHKYKAKPTTFFMIHFEYRCCTQKNL